MNKSLTQITDLSPSKILEIIDTALKFKMQPEAMQHYKHAIEDKVVTMIFEKPSLRTKTAFTIATSQMGGTPIFLTSQEILASGNNERGRESISDIAKNLEGFSNLLLARVYSHETIKEIAQTCKIPIINALCDLHHPTQALTDIMTIIFHKKHYKGLKVAFVGDGNNVAISLMQICALLGIHFHIATPEGYEIPLSLWTEAQEMAIKSGGTISFTHLVEEAVKNADVIYTDTFVSMGEEDKKNQKLKAFEGFQVNMSLLKKAKENAIFMHCLPAHRGEEVTNEVIDCMQSVVFDQAVNRIYIAKSLLLFFLT